MTMFKRQRARKKKKRRTESGKRAWRGGRREMEKEDESEQGTDKGKERRETQIG